MDEGLRDYGFCPACGSELSCVVQDGNPLDGIIYCPVCGWDESQEDSAEDVDAQATPPRPDLSCF